MAIDLGLGYKNNSHKYSFKRGSAVRSHGSRRHGRRNRRRGGGQGGNPPNILPAKKIESLKIATYKSVYSKKAKIGS